MLTSDVNGETIDIQLRNVRMVFCLTHGVTHICVSKLTINGADNGMSPSRRQAIIWTNIGILLIWNLGSNLRGILSEIHAV